MSLWGALYVGSSGLKTSQNALNTVAHNLANADTKGYTRQQILQSDKKYHMLSETGSAISAQQIGLGTVYSRSKQVRDVFLDQSYRRESGRSEFYKVSSEVMDEVETQLGEMNGEAFETNITDLWTAVQELVKDPASSVTQGLFVQRASELMTRAQGIYDGLSSYQDNLNIQIKQQVEKINSYGKQILELNNTIQSIEVGGVEEANDYRDARNNLLDELGQLADISWSEDVFGNISVRIENIDFVKDGVSFDIGLKMDESTGFYQVFWPQNAHYTLNADGEKEYQVDGALVFDLNREISSDKQTDIGGLKAMLLARGDHRADYTDIENNYDAVSQSVVMNIQAEFDQMIHHMTSDVNDVLDKLLEKIKDEADDEKIIVKVKSGYQSIPLNEIKYIEVNIHDLYYHCKNGTYQSRGVLKEIEKQLPNDKFVNCSNCYLVNLDFVDSILKNDVKIGDDLLKISKNKKKTVKYGAKYKLKAL